MKKTQIEIYDTQETQKELHALLLDNEDREIVKNALNEYKLPPQWEQKRKKRIIDRINATYHGKGTWKITNNYTQEK